MTVNVVLAPASNCVGRLLIVKRAAPDPFVVTPAIPSVALPTFASVKVFVNRTDGSQYQKSAPVECCGAALFVMETPFVPMMLRLDRYR